VGADDGSDECESEASAVLVGGVAVFEDGRAVGFRNAAGVVELAAGDSCSVPAVFDRIMGSGRLLVEPCSTAFRKSISNTQRTRLWSLSNRPTDPLGKLSATVR
jgi:hypothetical protein